MWPEADGFHDLIKRWWREAEVGGSPSLGCEEIEFGKGEHKKWNKVPWRWMLLILLCARRFFWS